MKHTFLRIAYPLLTSLLLLSAVTVEGAGKEPCGVSAEAVQPQQSATDADYGFQLEVEENGASQNLADDASQEGLLDEPHVYTVGPGMEEWDSCDSLIKMAAICDVPTEELRQMTTRALYQTVLDYPLLVNICAFGDLQTGISSVSQYFGGLQELFSRPDALDVMREYEIAEDDENGGTKAVLAECLQNYYEVMHLSKVLKAD